ncbi:MAG: hypothetical protein HUJ51_02590 [Eggerthellaceae bacterium]|nr:hypothetical protein [Eggerthellaceae bacterium]
MSFTNGDDYAIWIHDKVAQASYDIILTCCGPTCVLLRNTGTFESYHDALEIFLNRAGISNNRSEGGSHV